MGGTARALRDLSQGLREAHAWGLLAWDDVLSRYRRTLLGPLWLTLSHGMFILALAIAYSVLFKQPLDHYLIYLASGMTVWILISSSLMEGPTIFLRAHRMMISYDLPASIHIYRAVLGQIITFAHHMLIYVAAVIVVTIAYGSEVVNANTLLVIPGLAVLVCAMLGWSTILATLGARYRDLAPAIAAVTQMLFMLTPIFWNRTSLPEDKRWIAEFNPLYHVIDIVRMPLLGEAPELLSWAVSLGIAATLLIAAGALYAWKRRQLSYWL